MARFSLSAFGVDRPGIVAAVSGALADLGCNLEDSSMTILRGYFAILLVLSTGPERTVRDLESALDPVAQQFGLTLMIRTIEESGGEAVPASTATPDAIAGRGEPWTIVVQGADHPGIVSTVTAALASAGGNVVDLATHLIGEPDAPVYLMTIRALLPAGKAGVAGAQQVREAASRAGVHCTVTHDDADIL